MPRRRNKIRWREGRQTLPALRKRRRTHRRDFQRGGTYDPVPVRAGMARQGVRNRLMLAAVGMIVTVACVATVFLWPQTYIATAALFAFGFCSFNASAALIMSARREESVHGLATQMQDVPKLSHEGGVDGSI